MAYEVPSSCFAMQLLKAVDCDLDVTVEEAIRRAELSGDPSTGVPSVSLEEIREAVLSLLLQRNAGEYADFQALEDALNCSRLESILRLMLTYGSVYINDEGSSWEPDVSPENGGSLATRDRIKASHLNGQMRTLLHQYPRPDRDEIRKVLDMLL